MLHDVYSLPVRPKNQYTFRLLFFPFCYQVTEETAQMVESVGHSVTLRGVVNVKGKGELTTYFVNTDQSSPPF